MFAPKDTVEQFFLDGGLKGGPIYFRQVKRRFYPLIIRLRKLFIAEHVDIVHTFLHSDILGFVSALLRVSSEGYQMLRENLCWMKNTVGRIKQVCYSIINSIIRPHFYKTVAVSAGLKDELVRYGVREDKVEIINIGSMFRQKKKSLRMLV